MKWQLLLIDDEPCILNALAELLTDDEITVTKAKDGIEGLKLLGEKSFDVVVSDISMPRMNGPEMFREARALGIFVPHIFFSATADEKLILELKIAGAKAVVRKPYFEKLSAEVNSVLIKKEFSMPVDLLKVAGAPGIYDLGHKF